jgi:succinate dehydrogenase / fumarate reductase cytochrome b subunit
MRGLCTANIEKLPMTPQIERPLSPFLTYRWTLTMIMSIIHRATGVALYAGTLLVAWWLIATASGPGAYACLQAFATSWIGRIVEFGFTWALIHHALSGLRYLVWDLGYGFGRDDRERLTQVALIGAIVLTPALWIGVYALGAGR